MKTGDINRVTELTQNYYRLKEAVKAGQEELANVEAELFQLIDEQVKQYRVDHPNKGEYYIDSTVVRGTRIVISEPRLKKELGAKQWDRVTKKVLDKDLLEAAIAVGDVNPTIVGSCSEEVKNKPYLRFKLTKKQHRTVRRAKARTK